MRPDTDIPESITPPTTDTHHPKIFLSQFLAACRPDELFQIFQEFNAATNTVLDAVPIDTGILHFTVTMPGGQNEQISYREYAIRDTPQARQWRTDKAYASRLNVLVTMEGDITASADILHDTSGEFELLCMARRLRAANEKSQPGGKRLPGDRQRAKTKSRNKEALLKSLGIGGNPAGDLEAGDLEPGDTFQ